VVAYRLKNACSFELGDVTSRVSMNDWVVHNETLGQTFGMADRKFKSTYERIPDGINEYRKIG
jgi:hypothetical protein